MWYRIYSCSPFYAMLASILGNRATSMEWMENKTKNDARKYGEHERKEKKKPVHAQIFHSIYYVRLCFNGMKVTRVRLRRTNYVT